MTHHDPNLVRAQQREIVRAFVREDFYAFYRLIFSILVPGEPFLPARHFRALARALEKVVSGETPRLLIAIPPRHGKSLLSSVALPAWILGRDPAAKIICASYGDQLAKDFALKTREVLRSQAFQAVFSGCALEAGGSSLEELRTTGKGYRLATSVNGVVTGKGASVIIVDDPMKAVDASSEAARNSVFEWVKTSLMSRFDKPAEGRMIVVMQRLHQDDLIGRLRDEGGFALLEMPGEASERQVFDLGQGESWAFEPGDLLFPERFDAQALANQRFDLGEAGFNAQILQRPVPPGGALLKLKHVQRYDALPHTAEMVVQSWDPAFVDSDTAAFTVCTTWGIVGRKLYLIDVFRKRLDFHQVEPAILSLKEKYHAKFVILEVAGVGRALGNSLLRLPDSRRWLVPVDPKLGKVERATSVTPIVERKRVHLPRNAPWLATFEQELVQFPHAKYCDQVDSMVHFLREMSGRTRITQDLSAFDTWPDMAF